MKYSLKMSKKVNDALYKMDKADRYLLLKWIYNNIHDSDNGKYQGKELKATSSVLWRYKVGKYKVIVKIKDDAIVVLAIDIAIIRNIKNGR